MDPEEKQRVNELLAASLYQVTDKLGQGAFAGIYVVQQTFIRKRFALKLIHAHLAEDVEYVARLRREARTLGRIESPHVVRIVDLATASNGAPYLVLELMAGRSLAEELAERGRLPAREAIKWAAQALKGLAAAHELGLVHRDITPANLYLQQGLTGERILKVVDFGLARVLPATGDSAVRGHDAMSTSTGTIVGSPAYASPEALRGERLTEAADIYGVGLVLFQMLTGKSPLEFDGAGVPAPSLTDSSISPSLDRLVAKATHPLKEKRYATANEFLREVHR